ncbi:MAG: hypothetical protein JWO00_468 [Candidatus Parcubacteria bacterium]|nr:hypothetical protein [Candidatus Parcubacteria bacterium]
MGRKTESDGKRAVRAGMGEDDVKATSGFVIRDLGERNYSVSIRPCTTGVKGLSVDKLQLLFPSKPLELSFPCAGFCQSAMLLAVRQRHRPASARILGAGLGIVVLMQALREVVGGTYVQSLIRAFKNVCVMHIARIFKL